MRRTGFLMPRTKLLASLFVLASLAACSKGGGELTNVKAEPWSLSDEAVVVDLTSTGSETGSPHWLATYRAGGKIAKLGIELGPDHAVDQFASTGDGRFLRERNSDPSIFLADLKKALDAKTVPTKITKVDSLPFKFVVLGRNQSRSSSGGFSSNPPGDWTAMKLFLANGEGEVFFNLSPTAKKAEFSIKDSDYGDIVLAELAKVL